MESAVTYQDVVARLAPCGLDCERCVMFVDGRVKRLASALLEALDGFDDMASRVADRMPELRHYAEFVDVLGLLAGAQCAGCRNGGPQFPFCAARTCFKEKGVDFCCQCEEYPCGRNAFPENLARRWRANNDRMREVGVETFYAESLKRPRY